MLDQAAEQVGLDASEAELIRQGSNAVYRLRSAPVVARVALSSRRRDAASREIAVARWLADNEVPAIRALDVEQPTEVDGRAVTFWESASEVVEYGTTAELATLLRKLHALDGGLDLPQHDPFGRAFDRLDSMPPSESVDYLFSRLRGMQPAYRSIQFELPEGVIHGDANVGNVIRDREGRAILADLDSFAIGPREWDLVLTALYFEHYGWHTADEYNAFVQRYGYDLMKWSGYPVMRDLRELLMVTWLAEKAAGDEEAETELQKRLHTLRHGGDRRDWLPL